MCSRHTSDEPVVNLNSWLVSAQQHICEFAQGTVTYLGKVVLPPSLVLQTFAFRMPSVLCLLSVQCSCMLHAERGQWWRFRQGQITAPLFGSVSAWQMRDSETSARTSCVPRLTCEGQVELKEIAWGYKRNVSWSSHLTLCSSIFLYKQQIRCLRDNTEKYHPTLQPSSLTEVLLSLS